MNPMRLVMPQMNVYCRLLGEYMKKSMKGIFRK